MRNSTGASVPDQALAVPVEPVARLDPTGFDPSRLEDAIAFAAHCYKGQRDKCGQPYILHPLRVMMRLDDEDARIAAVLHDVIEDSDVEPVFIRMGYGDAVGAAVEALTRGEDEPYADYIERCGANDIARRVKWADLRDNLDPVRLAAIPEPTRARLIAKYRPALDRINAIAMETQRAETPKSGSVAKP